MMSRLACPHCGKLLVMPAGTASSPILLVGEFPGVEEIKSGVPFVGKTGDVLSSELSRVGINLRSTYMTNLWLHQEDKDCKLDYHMDHLIASLAGRKYILLMGSSVMRALTGKGVMEMSGLIVKSDYLPRRSVAVACPNPASAFKRGSTIGEMRHAIKTFKEVMERYENGTAKFS